MCLCFFFVKIDSSFSTERETPCCCVSGGFEGVSQKCPSRISTPSPVPAQTGSDRGAERGGIGNTYCHIFIKRYLPAVQDVAVDVRFPVCVL